MIIDAHKRMIADIGIYALQHYTLQQKQDLRDHIARIALDLDAAIERINAMPKHGLLAYVGKSPDEIETIKAEIEAQVHAANGSEPEQKIAPVDGGGDAA